MWCDLLIVRLLNCTDKPNNFSPPKCYESFLKEFLWLFKAVLRNPPNGHSVRRSWRNTFDICADEHSILIPTDPGSTNSTPYNIALAALISKCPLLHCLRTNWNQNSGEMTVKLLSSHFPETNQHYRIAARTLIFRSIRSLQTNTAMTISTYPVFITLSHLGFYATQ